jgi:hypothetical protein
LEENGLLAADHREKGILVNVVPASTHEAQEDASEGEHVGTAASPPMLGRTVNPAGRGFKWRRERV